MASKRKKSGRIVGGVGTETKLPPGGYRCDNGCGAFVLYMGDEHRQYNGCPGWEHLPVLASLVDGAIIVKVVEEDTEDPYVRWLHLCPACKNNIDPERFRALGWTEPGGVA